LRRINENFFKSGTTGGGGLLFGRFSIPASIRAHAPEEPL
jgi:hypothetical protein